MVYDKNDNAWHPDVYPPAQPPNFQLTYNTVNKLISILAFIICIFNVFEFIYFTKKVQISIKG